MSKEAMKLALEALKADQKLIEAYRPRSHTERLLNAIKALEEALSSHIPDATKMVSGVKDSLTTQQEQGEPDIADIVADELKVSRGTAYDLIIDSLNKRGQDKPDYWLGYGLQAHTEKPFEGATPVYTTPQQRTWVGLTHEECFDIIHTWNRLHKNDWDAAAQMILMVETKLKEKNT